MTVPHVEIKVPPSKSATQRALVLASLGERACNIRNPLDCDDSRMLRNALAEFGVQVSGHKEGWIVTPPDKYQVPAGVLFLENAGTAVRFLAGLSIVLPGPYTIDGNKAMRSRPMSSLLDALRRYGVQVNEQGKPGCPPVELYNSFTNKKSVAYPPVVLRLVTGISSQELSAILLAGAAFKQGLDLVLDGDIPSLPYVRLTLGMLRSFGLHADEKKPGLFEVRGGPPRISGYEVEGDWSSASYPLAAGMLTGRKVELENVRQDSLQGDKAIPGILEELGQPENIDLDMGETPDLVPTVIACALFRKSDTRITNVSHLRYKESNRLLVLVNELAKLGALIEETPDGIHVRPSRLKGEVTLNPHKDHRMAMAFGLVSLRVPGIRVMDQSCVSKSYPGFWEMLEAFR
ncbi:MAG: 3-phosphoshikimate 1-carboxyvinyltransferase [Deltaproteobacteria bacterium]|nr:3-phosphoshikimate 1-carboxyvinyltransferase [Deltaproteobacteria bacterium]